MAVAALSRARALHRLARWDDACVEFLAADAEGALEVDDLELLAEAAQLTGRHAAAAAALERTFTLCASAGDVTRAARAAFWLYSEFLYAGEFSRAGGWMSRLRDLAEELDGVEQPGWLHVATAHTCIGQGRYEDARAALTGALEQGRRQGDVDLETFARLLTARSLLLSGRPDEGLAQLDDAMLNVTGGRTSPRMTSLLFCAAIGTCETEAWEQARAQEWATDLEQWMASLPTVFGGAFLDNCRVYRAVLRRRRGELAAARGELEHAASSLAEGPGILVAGHAWYELGEVHRLLGEDAAAELAYRRATASGASPQPGLALLRFRQGDSSAAIAGLRRSLAETSRPQARGHLLPTLVTVALSVGALDEARDALVELSDLASSLGSAALEAEVARAQGEVALVDGRPEVALPSLRRAANAWRQLREPYETARTCALVGEACRALGDEEGGRLELEAARDLFATLGTRRDVEAVEALIDGTPVDRALSTRELQVLRLIAVGRTNQSIATELHLSERTVHRHVSNLFVKVGVHSRAEAAAYAVEHRLLPAR